ncbi:MAG TPA: GNAT family N-acetyltransferase [Iamia sp.]|nr:GNAT family N-acetyltransferase [Iamia sp.]
MAGLDVRPLEEDDWDDLVALFGTRGDPAWCWCQFFVTTGGGYSAGSRAERVRRNQPALLRQVRSTDRPLGVLARADGEPVGWLALGPRPSYPRLTGSRALLAVTGDDARDETVWATTCFVVRVGMRRRGVSGALLAAGIDLARDQGASVLEGHPVDLDAHDRPPGSATLYHGAASVYRRAGFREVGRTSPTRPVLRLAL